MFDSSKNSIKKKMCKEKWFFYIWFSYEKYERKSNIIKIN